MSHLKLVVTNNPRKLKLPPPADTQRPVPTAEFLTCRVLALPFCGQTIGGAVAEMADYLRPDAPDALQQASAITDALMLIGIWIFPPVEDDDPPTHGLVVYPAKLAKRYPELKRVLDQLDGLQLMPPAA